MTDLHTQPVWQVWLLEDPTVPIVVVLLAAAVCYITLRKQSRKKARITLTTLLFIALFNYLLAQFWQTEHERVATQTTEFVKQASSRNALKMQALMTENASVTASGKACLAGTQTLLDRYEQAANSMKLRDHAASIEGVEVKEDQARVLLRVTTALAPTYGRDSVTTTWLFHWQREATGEWKLTELEWLKLGPTDASCSAVP